MKHNKAYIFIILILSIPFISCENIFEAEDENLGTMDRIYQNPAFAEGLLMTAYIKLPTNGLSFNDLATDDAVSNDESNGYRRMATGQWSAQYNPASLWDSSISAIFYLNKFISVIDTVTWKWTDSELNRLYKVRLRGEAYALRGLFEYYLLVTTGGIGGGGELLGIPLYNNFIESDGNFNIPRASFRESVDQIYADFDKALEYLTMDDYGDISSLSELPEGLEDIKSVANYNLVFGKDIVHRISGKIIKALKARVALLEASPAFSAGDIVLWEKAANYAAEVLDKIGGISGLDPNGHRFYNGSFIDAIDMSKGKDQKEVLWRNAKYSSLSLETRLFPPSLYGQGDVNPTQNLVDAFPMANGFPITDPESLFDQEKPYVNRDPRLSLYILHNNSVLKGENIQTGAGGGINAKDSISQSTRTGYYIRKLLREDVNLDPVARISKDHYSIHMRYTELFLIYAEAANEAWGPEGVGAHSYSSKDVIRAIRKRAGITQPDLFLASVSTKEEMRELIRNERRIELCFEGFRFWDLRRWKEDLTESAKGINISDSNYTIVQVEDRKYDNSFMIYGPLPYNDILKYNSLIQNKGW
ncbi:RagB/SusD family nutrient uptake outer membrane protein [Proteiniphilum propionicum]|jgi:hypothetical protein|uniref:RagB/SusD family nutrient uptake outer membrane protein n=1 Tax=Proteiniphilum propionicum TaxID=2829812 RepID=UPI001EEBE720|nr:MULTISPECIES: RagB/SusD family nutrient uptake outer membrane protein [Proteiniphilum]ULB34755.1 RagB/SusD family nutrient uptake outer membrane protein [Proteiniphilum propionicum]